MEKTIKDMQHTRASTAINPSSKSKEEYSSGCISRANLQFNLKRSEKKRKGVFKSMFRKLTKLADVEQMTEAGFSEMARESFNIQSDFGRPNEQRNGSFLGMPLNFDNSNRYSQATHHHQ